VSVRHRATPVREQGGWLTALCLASVLVVLAARVHPPGEVTEAWRSQLLGLVSVATTTLVAATVLMSPGLVLRARWDRAARAPLAVLPLPGVGCLLAVGILVWGTARSVDPHDTAQVGLLVILAATGAAGWRAGPFLDHGERRVLRLAALVFLFAIGRSLWSQGADGELYRDQIERTLEVGDRPDSRISYQVAALVAHGLGPYSEASQAWFTPYSFLDRGPIPGIVSSAVMLAMGTTPPPVLPEQPWTVYDVQGFMAYRIVMLMLALMALPAVYSLVRLVAGPSRALLAAVLVSTTPFFIHETYFTWPKLAATSLCLMAGYAVLCRRHLAAGLLVGCGYLMHPLALIALPTLGLVALLVEYRRTTNLGWGWRRYLGQAVLSGGALGIGTAAVVGIWRGLNRGHTGNGHFLRYVLQADAVPDPSFGEWLAARGTSIANTVIPFYRLRDTADPSINSIYAPSNDVVHFFFQYWTSLPFSVGIVFFPLLLLGLARATRCAPVATTFLVVVPFLAFAVYWGSYDAGLMREGLHPWFLTALAVWCIYWPGRPRDGRVGLPTRVTMGIRVLGALAMALGPAWSFTHTLVAPGHRLGDVAALSAMLVAAAALFAAAVRFALPLEPVAVNVSEARSHP
jgi:hypothetical protein